MEQQSIHNQEWWDCGYVGGIGDFPKTDCPSLPEELRRMWLDGWSAGVADINCVMKRADVAKRKGI